MSSVGGLLLPMVTSASTAASSAAAGGSSPMCLYMKDHGRLFCESLQLLRLQNGLVDLDIVCEEQHLQVHKVVMAAASKFFKTQLCKANVMVPVILQLEDFGLELRRDAVSFLIEFVYRGEVVIPGDRLADVCFAAHALGINGLTDFLPNTLSSGEKSSKDPVTAHGDQPVPIVTIDEEQVHHVVVSLPSVYASASNPSFVAASQSSESVLLQQSSTFGHGRDSHQDASLGFLQQALNQQQESYAHHNPNTQQYVQTVYHTPASSEGIYSHQHHLHASANQSIMLATFGHENHAGGGAQSVDDIILQHNLPQSVNTHVTQPSALSFSSVPTKNNVEQVLSGKKMLKQNSFNSDSNSSDFGSVYFEGSQSKLGQPGLLLHPSPGKLRVINQGLMNNVAENIHSTSKNHTPSPSDDEDTIILGGEDDISQMSTEIDGRQVDQQQSLMPSNVIHTPINSTQLAWLNSKHESGIWTAATSSGDENHGDELILYEHNGDEMFVSGGGIWTLPNGSRSEVEIGEGTSTWTVPSEGTNPGEGWQNALGGVAAVVTQEEDSNSKGSEKSAIATDPWSGTNHLLLTPAGSLFVAEDNMLAIRSGVPLALQNRKRRPAAAAGAAAAKRKGGCAKVVVKKGDLGVRKDLTLATATAAGQDNVFQPDDICSSSSFREFPVVHLDDGDCQVTIHGSGEADKTEEENERAGNSKLVAAAAAGKDYQCVECTMEFAREHQLRQHVRHAHQKEESLYCPVCKMGEIKGKESLKMHLFKHHGLGDMFRCEECNYESSIKGNFLRHLSDEHQNSRILKCDKCDKTFRSRMGLKLHLKKHLNEQNFRCTDCAFGTTQKLNLVKHMATKHRKGINGVELQAEFACSICDFKCVAAYQLKAHQMRKHTSKDQMRFKCETCDYATVEKPALEKHIRFKHTNERPFMCTTCGFSTHTMSSMARHRRTHSNTKPFKCDICDQSYADKKRLRDHKLKHDGKQPFSCDHCDFQCRRKDNLHVHVRKLHLSPKKSKIPMVNTSREQPEPSKIQSPRPKTEKVRSRHESNKSRHDSFSGSHAAEPLHASSALDPPRHKSHIVGHINQDGSIRPVFSNNPADISCSNPVDSGGLNNIQETILLTKTMENPENPGTTEEIIVVQSNQTTSKTANKNNAFPNSDYECEEIVEDDDSIHLQGGNKSCSDI